MPKHASHATLERERTLSRIVADDEPAVSPAALEECFGVLPLGDADFEMLDIVGVSDADELDLDVADLVEVAAPRLCRRRRSWRRQRIRQRRRRGWSRRR